MITFVPSAKLLSTICKWMSGVRGCVYVLPVGYVLFPLTVTDNEISCKCPRPVLSLPWLVLASALSWQGEC